MLLVVIHQQTTKSPASQTICIVWARWRQTRKTHMTSHWDIVCCGLLPDEETSVTCFDSNAQLAADSQVSLPVPSHCPRTCLPWPRTWICSGFCDLTLILQLLSEWCQIRCNKNINTVCKMPPHCQMQLNLTHWSFHPGQGALWPGFQVQKKVLKKKNTLHGGLTVCCTSKGWN